MRLIRVRPWRLLRVRPTEEDEKVWYDSPVLNSLKDTRAVVTPWYFLVRSEVTFELSRFFLNTARSYSQASIDIYHNIIYIQV